MLLALMTGAAVLAVLLPLSRVPVEAEPAGDVPFYKAQLAEIDRDRDRGLLGADEAEAARIESGRRLLRASAAGPDTMSTTSEPALRRRRAASALALFMVPIVGLALYGGLGSPQLVAQAPSTQAPQAAGVRAPSTEADAARLGAADGRPDLASALKQVEDHLAANPDDMRGWEIVAPIYLRIGRLADAARAFREARRIGGDTPGRLLGEGEALVGGAQGVVEPAALALFRRALELEPGSPPARYYVALAAEQAGARGEAVAGFRGLLADSPADAPWIPLVRSRLAGLGEVTAGEVPAGEAAPASRLAASPEIMAMVSGLDERLRAGGGSEAEWSRLVRSFVVLGRREDALDRLARGRVALAGDADGLARLDQSAAELGLVAGIARR